MSVLEWRGGFPVAHAGTVTTAGVFTPDASRGAAHDFAADGGLPLGVNMQHWNQEGRKPGCITSKWLEMRNLDAGAGNAVRVYFSQQSFDDDADYIEIPGGASALSKWAGPYEAEQFWARATAGTPNLNIIAANRRG